MENTIHKSFNPVDYCFTWTNDWYEWDFPVAHRFAKDDRDKEALLLKRQGYTVKKSTVKNQLITRGGIGSGHPHVEFVVTVYKFTATKKKSQTTGYMKVIDEQAMGYMQGRGAA